MFDPFGLGLPVYSFASTCEENLSLKLDDGVGTIVLNSRSNKVAAKELASFFDYLNKQRVSKDDPLIKAIDEKVKELNDEKWRRMVRTLDDKIKEEKCFSFEEGKREGARVGKREERKINIKNTIEILKELDLSDNEIEEKVSSKFHLTPEETKEYLEL